MDTITSWLAGYGVATVFVGSLLEQLGLPLPAYPLLMLAAALSVEGYHSAWSLLMAASAGSILADLAWYLAGQKFGHRILGALCRFSLSPDSCVHQSNMAFARWGAASMLVARFIPGLSIVAATMAGITRLNLTQFLIVDAVGALVYAGGAIYAGVRFHATVTAAVNMLARAGSAAVCGLLGAAALYGLVKWLRRRLASNRPEVQRVSVHDLHSMMHSPARPLVLDTRSPMRRTHDGFIPGSVAISPAKVLETIEPLPANRLLVLCCDCTREETAAALAGAIKLRGRHTARALSGG